jgi:hypothetical protein
VNICIKFLIYIFRWWKAKKNIKIVFVILCQVVGKTVGKKIHQQFKRSAYFFWLEKFGFFFVFHFRNAK